MFLSRRIHLPLPQEYVRKRIRECALPGSNPRITETAFQISVRMDRLGHRGFSSPYVFSGTILREYTGTALHFTVNPNPAGLLFVAAGLSIAVAKAIRFFGGETDMRMFWISLLAAALAAAFTLAQESECLDHFEAMLKSASSENMN
jgi:hypothetical protein